MKSAIVGHLVGAVVAALIGLLAAILYMFVEKTILGHAKQGMDGLAMVATLIVFPIANGVFTLLLWAPTSMLWQRKKGLPSGRNSLLAGLALGFVVAMIWAGPSGFTTRGGASLYNYYLIPMFGLAALVDTWFVRRFAQSRAKAI